MRTLHQCLLSYLLLALTPAMAWAQSTVTGVNTIGASLPIGAGGSIAMTILSNGNVGVGTVAPIQKFVVSNGGAEGIEINPAREGANTAALFALNRSGGSQVDLYIGANAFHFQTPIDANERLTITSAGKVGIGTTSPSVLLDVANGGGGAALDAGEVAQFAQNSNTYLTIRANASHTLILGYEGQAELGTFSNDALNFVVNNSSHMTINTSGYVGIGTTSPAAPLDVDGMTYLESNVGIGVAPTVSYGLDVNGTVLATAYYHSSDARLKTDIHPINHALGKIMALKGVEFNWKKDGRPDMGVTAQNVSEVFPSVVTKGPDGMMSVEYDSMIGPMIEAIRELKAENDRLAARVDFLEKSVSQGK